jgi:Ca2+-binding EF-hand superfamily protein
MTSKILIGGTALVMALTATVALADARGQGPRMDFATMDANSDGSITIEDIEALRAQRFAALDADGNGSVSRQEFMDHAAGRAGDRAGTMFDRLDSDGDGVLSRDAIEARRGDGPDAGRMISRFDTDGDGAVSQEEFDAAKTKMRDRAEMRKDRMGGHDGKRHGDGRADKG